MTDAFASLVSPVLQHLVDLQLRLEAGENPSLASERERVLVLLDEAERKASESSALAHDFALAKHALVYWIDEILINSQWAHATEWRQQILEWDIYHERLRSERFFEKAHDAEGLANTDALETFYLCVALGFRGRHVDSPGDLRKWADRAYNRIIAGSRQPDKFLPDDAVERAPLHSLPGQSILLAVSVLVSISALLTLACFVIAIPPR